MERELKNLNKAIKFLALVVFLQGRITELLLEKCHMEEDDRLVLQSLCEMPETFLKLSPIHKVLEEMEIQTLSSELVHIARSKLASMLQQDPWDQLEQDLILAKLEEALKKLFS